MNIVPRPSPQNHFWNSLIYLCGLGVFACGILIFTVSARELPLVSDLQLSPQLRHRIQEIPGAVGGQRFV